MSEEDGTVTLTKKANLSGSSFSIKDHLDQQRREFKARQDLYRQVQPGCFSAVFDANYKIGESYLRGMVFRAEKSYWRDLENGGKNSESIQKTIDQLVFTLDQYVLRYQEVERLRNRVSFLEDKIEFHKVKI